MEMFGGANNVNGSTEKSFLEETTFDCMTRIISTLSE